jgi:threonyl-tRNA synthetase
VALTIELPDGSKREYPEGTTGLDVAESIGSRLAKAAVAVRHEGELLDLSTPLPGDGLLQVITGDSEDGLFITRHSSAHVMAQAVLDLFDGAHFAIGPPITDGFYYDFDIGRPFTPADIEAIESRMHEIIAEDQPFERDQATTAEGLEIFKDQPFKTEIITDGEAAQGAGDGVVTLYRNLDFVDLCRGPHVPSTGRINAVKLLRSAGAYWRGDEHRQQLQRIYGTAWDKPQALSEYLERLEQAEARDHRKLGRELDLYSFPHDIGPGLAVWHPKGGMLRKLVEDYSRRIHEDFGFDFVFSPHLAKSELWNTSGHLDFYAEGMYPGIVMDADSTGAGTEYRVKPMNCPFHVLIYRSQARSYRDLPLRFAELGAVYRNEMSGVVHGLLRARGFTQDDSHTFCRRDQVADELASHLEFVLSLLTDFGFEDFEADLSTRPEEKWVGELELWDLATESLRQALDKAEVPYEVAEGEGAFYGPKIDVHVRDAIGRRWQMSTIQVDFSLPERFDLEFNDAENHRQQPVMIHSAKFGSVERFIGVLVEHYAGAFPGWLAPVQATIVPVADRHVEYGHQVASEFSEHGLRVEVDESSATVGEKLRRAITHKHPAVVVVGDDDIEHQTVGLRMRGQDSDERGVGRQEATERLLAETEVPR